MTRKLQMYGCIVVSYLIVDVAYQALIGIKLMADLYAKAGIDGIMAPAPQYPATIALFFLVMAYVLLKLAVLPAMEKRSVGLALTNGALVGIASYGTLALVFLWSIAGFPVTAALEMLFEGLVFPTVASGVTAWLFLRRAAAV